MPPLAEATLRAHARQCAACGRVLEEELEFRDLVAEAARSGPSLDWEFTRRVIDALPPRSAPPAPGPIRRAFLRATLPLATAAVVALCVVLGRDAGRAAPVVESAAFATILHRAGASPTLAAPGDVLAPKDALSTPPSDLASVALGGGGRVVLGPSTRLETLGAAALALREGEIAVATPSGGGPLSIEVAGRAVSVAEGSAVRLEVRPESHLEWTAEVTAGSVAFGDRTFTAGQKIRAFGSLGPIPAPLSEGEASALEDLIASRPSDPFDGPAGPRDERAAAAALLASPDLSSSPVRRVAALAARAELGDREAIVSLLDVALARGQDSASALRAIGCLSPGTRRDLAPALAEELHVPAVSLPDWTAVLASSHPDRAMAVVRETLDGLDRATSPKPDDHPDSREAESILRDVEDGAGALSAAAVLFEFDPSWFLGEIDAAENRLRLALLAVLAMTGDPQFAPIWAAILDDPDPRFRALGARGFRFIRDGEAAPALLAAIERETSPEARMALVAALSDLALDRRYDDAIVARLLADWDSEGEAAVARFAAHGLARRVDQLPRDVLERLVRTAGEAELLGAIEALYARSVGTLPKEPTATFLAVLPADHLHLVLGGVVQHGCPAALDAILGLALDPSRPATIRVLALDAASRSGAPTDAIVTVCRALAREVGGDASGFAKESIVNALAALAPRAAAAAHDLAPFVAEGLDDPARAPFSARALVALDADAPAALERLRRSVGAGGSEGGRFAVARLALGDSDAIDAVAAMIQSGGLAAVDSARALSGLPLVDGVIEALESVASSGPNETSLAAVRALGALDAGLATEAARRRLAAASGDGDRLLAARELAALGDDGGMECLRGILLEDGAALAAIARKLGITAAEARARTEEAASRPGGTAFAGFLDGLLLSRDAGRSGRQSETDETERQDTARLARVAARILHAIDASRSRLVDDLSAGVVSARSERRVLTIRAIAALHESETIEFLEALASAAGPDVRAAVRDALAAPPPAPAITIDRARREVRAWIDRTIREN